MLLYLARLKDNKRILLKGLLKGAEIKYLKIK